MTDTTKIETNADTTEAAKTTAEPKLEAKATETGDADKAKTEEATKLEADKAEREAEVQARAEKLAKKLAAAAVKEATEKAQREAAEAAELSKKSDLERAQAAQKKAEEKLAEANANATAAQLKADLAEQMNEQKLRAASPKAREHIAAAYKAHVAEGKDPADALKAVKAEEGYLFEQPVAPKTETKAAATTGPKAGGKDERAVGDVSATKTGTAAIPNPGDLVDPMAIAAAMRAKHGISPSFN